MFKLGVLGGKGWGPSVYLLEESDFMCQMCMVTVFVGK